jgi:predicted MPP superfamily phosphohydrolase
VLPPGSPELKVLHLSDLHMAPWQRAKQRFLRELGELEPDLVVDTGDNLGHDLGLLGVRAALEPFRGVPGVFVWGSNDYWAPSFKNPLGYLFESSGTPPRQRRLDRESLHEYLLGLGWTDLDNAGARLVVKGVPLDLVGVDDPHRHYDRLVVVGPELERLRSTGPTAALTVGVAHAPYRRVLDAFVDHGAGLLLAGHTHGGQVAVPFVGALTTNSDLPRRQAKGLSEWEYAGRRVPLNVSAGVGTSIFAPVRFACRPEVSLLTLEARA